MYVTKVANYDTNSLFAELCDYLFILCDGKKSKQNIRSFLVNKFSLYKDINNIPQLLDDIFIFCGLKDKIHLLQQQVLNNKDCRELLFLIRHDFITDDKDLEFKKNFLISVRDNISSYVAEVVRLLEGIFNIEIEFAIVGDNIRVLSISPQQRSFSLDV